MAQLYHDIYNFIHGSLFGYLHYVRTVVMMVVWDATNAMALQTQRVIRKKVCVLFVAARILYQCQSICLNIWKNTKRTYLVHSGPLMLVCNTRHGNKYWSQYLRICSVTNYIYFCKRRLNDEGANMCFPFSLSFNKIVVYNLNEHMWQKFWIARAGRQCGITFGERYTIY